MPPIEFSKITAATSEGLPPSQTVFFFPVAPLEDHGPHLPLGLDLREAEMLCKLAAERLEKEMPGWVGVIMPAVPLGCSSNTTRLAITVRNYVLRDWLVDACRSLIRSGFKHFVCFSGQLGPSQLTAIEEAGKTVSRQGPFTALYRLFTPPHDPRSIRPYLLSASSALATGKEVSRSPLWPDPKEHGSKRDTSVALWLGAACKNESEIAALPAINPHPSYLGRLVQRVQRKTAGYWGPSSPGTGNASWGETTLRGELDEVFPKLRAVWEGANPRSAFRSWYSILPPNQSYFKAWLLIAMILAVFIGWAYLMGQNLGTS